MIIRKFCFIGFMLFGLVQISIGQNKTCNISLQGNISDNHENLGLEFATVFVKEIQNGTVTDKDGNFEIKNLCPGKYHIIVSHIGCESKTLFIDIQQDTMLDISMEHHDELLDEVIIEGKNSQSRTGLQKSVVSKEMIKENTGKNLSDMLIAIPGVNTLRSGPNLSKPIINGLFGNRITILNNGIPQEGQQWGNDHAPEIDPNTGDKISVYKGSSAIKYGLSALGGLVVLEPEELQYDPHWHGDFTAGTQSNGRIFTLNTTLFKSLFAGNTRWTASYTKGGDRQSPKYYLTNTASTESAASLLITNKSHIRHNRKLYFSFYHNESGILRGSHAENLTDLIDAFEREIPQYTNDNFSYQINAPKQVVNHYLAKYFHKISLTEHKTITFEGAFQANSRQEFDIRRGDRTRIPSLNLTLFSQYYDLQYNFLPENQALLYSIGLQYKNNNNYNNPGTGISPLIPNYLNHQIAVYFIHKNTWFSLPVEFGLRNEIRSYHIYKATSQGGNSQHQFYNFAANTGIKKEITKTLTTSLDISYTARPPEINELYSNGLHQGVSGIEEGNNTLNAEQSLKIVNEWNGHLHPKHHLNLSIYYNRFNDFIYLLPTGELRLTIRGAFPVFKYVGADIAMTGFSLKSTHEINSSLQWKNSLHYIYAQNLNTDQGLIRIPPFNISSGFSFLSGKTKLYNELKCSLDISYTAKQTHVNVEEDFLPPPSDYFLMNASVKFKWKTKNHHDLYFIIKGENLLNVSYRDYLNRMRYFANDLGRNVYFTITYKF